jgi:hypothetical protein
MRKPDRQDAEAGRAGLDCPHITLGLTGKISVNQRSARTCPGVRGTGKTGRA